jgi:hypothetical protein
MWWIFPRSFLGENLIFILFYSFQTVTIPILLFEVAMTWKVATVKNKYYKKN